MKDLGLYQRCSTTMVSGNGWMTESEKQKMLSDLCNLDTTGFLEFGEGWQQNLVCSLSISVSSPRMRLAAIQGVDIDETLLGSGPFRYMMCLKELSKACATLSDHGRVVSERLASAMDRFLDEGGTESFVSMATLAEIASGMLLDAYIKKTLA